LIAIPHQPYFIGQPTDVSVSWGYGMFVEKPGNFVKQPMSACHGREIITELLGHLHIEAEAARIMESSACIPCMMPFITSQFLARQHGGRPQILPKGPTNLAFMGQFYELPEDVVFTVEYSICSAQIAVSALLGLKRAACGLSGQVPPMRPVYGVCGVARRSKRDDAPVVVLHA
jgi:oleate hydratase